MRSQEWCFCGLFVFYACVRRRVLRKFKPYTRLTIRNCKLLLQSLVAVYSIKAKVPQFFLEDAPEIFAAFLF